MYAFTIGIAAIIGMTGMTSLLRKAQNFLSYHFNDAPGRFTYAAAMNNFAEVDRLLTQYGPSLINKTGITKDSAVMCAARNGYAGMVEHLIERGADVNYRDHTGKTALMVAAFSGHQNIYKLLVAKGADESLVDEYGRDAKAHAKLGRAWGRSSTRTTSSGDNQMMSPAHLASPLNIFNPFK